MPNPVVHFEVMGKDPKVLQKFYVDAFGWRTAPAGPTYAMMHPETEGGINGGVGSPADGSSASYVTFYVAVPDIEAAFQKIESLGGKRMWGPFDVPDGGPTIAMFTDPEGHAVGLVKAQ